MDIWSLYSTFSTRGEAVSVARALLDARLIACANIHDNVTSLYRWEGAICQEAEVVLIAKTAKNRLEEAISLIKKLHSYALPCIVASPVSAGFPPFMQWVADETSV